MSLEEQEIINSNLPKDIITEVKIFKSQKEGKILAYVNITLFDTFVVKNLRIVQGNKGVFIGMPSIRRKDGQYRDIFFPIKQDARKLITNRLIEAYEEQTGEKISNQVEN